MPVGHEGAAAGTKSALIFLSPKRRAAVTDVDDASRLVVALLRLVDIHLSNVGALDGARGTRWELTRSLKNRAQHNPRPRVLRNFAHKNIRSNVC